MQVARSDEQLESINAQETDSTADSSSSLRVNPRLLPPFQPPKHLLRRESLSTSLLKRVHAKLMHILRRRPARIFHIPRLEPPAESTLGRRFAAKVRQTATHSNPLDTSFP